MVDIEVTTDVGLTTTKTSNSKEDEIKTSKEEQIHNKSGLKVVKIPAPKPKEV